MTGFLPAPGVRIKVVGRHGVDNAYATIVRVSPIPGYFYVDLDYPVVGSDGITRQENILIHTYNARPFDILDELAKL